MQYSDWCLMTAGLLQYLLRLLLDFFCGRRVSLGCTSYLKCLTFTWLPASSMETNMYLASFMAFSLQLPSALFLPLRLPSFPKRCIVRKMGPCTLQTRHIRILVILGKRSGIAPTYTEGLHGFQLLSTREAGVCCFKLPCTSI